MILRLYVHIVVNLADPVLALGSLFQVRSRGRHFESS